MRYYFYINQLDPTYPTHSSGLNLIRILSRMHVHSFVVLTPVGNQCGNVNPENRDQPPNPAGYLASTASVSVECGSPQHPWILEFSPGQRINVTLVDFVAVPSTNLTRQSSINFEQHNQHCQVIAVIKEKTPVRSVTICGGGVERERTVYISESHSIEVRLMTISKSASEGGHYLIRYEGQ